MFEYSRMNNPYTPFIDDRKYFKHVGVSGPSPSQCREQYTDIPAQTQNRMQRVKNKKLINEKRNQKNKRKNKDVESDKSSSDSQYETKTQSESDYSTRATISTGTITGAKPRRERSSRSRIKSFAVDDEPLWEDLPYAQQKANYLVCSIQI